MEESGWRGAGTGWTPRHLVLEDRDGRAIGAILYLKEHSPGRVRVRFFPGRTAYADVGVDTTEAGHGDPLHAVAAPAFLVRRRRRRARRRRRDSSGHGVCTIRTSSPRGQCCIPTRIPLAPLSRRDSSAPRLASFHWFNRSYDSFEEFLATFTSEKAQEGRRERRRVGRGRHWNSTRALPGGSG